MRFASPSERAAFASEFAEAVRALPVRYHADSAPDARTYRVVELSHLRPRGSDHDRPTRP